MPTEFHKLLAQSLETIASTNLDDLRREDLGRDLNFNESIPDIQRASWLFLELSELDLAEVPAGTIRQCNECATNFIERIRSIKEFSLAEYSNNPAQQKRVLQSTLRNQFEQHWFPTISPVISYASRKKTIFENEKKQVESIISEIKNQEEHSNREQSRILNELNSTLETIRNAAQEVGVSQHASYFKEQANIHKNLSKGWLLATIATAIFTLVYLFYGTSWIHLPPLDPQQQPSPLDLTQFVVTRILIFSVLSYALYSFGKNYLAHRHNQVVNQHRQNALSTFEAFAKAASDNPTKTAVLIQATQCIFTHMETGYLGKDRPPMLPQARLIEIVKDMSARSPTET